MIVLHTWLEKSGSRVVYIHFPRARHWRAVLLQFYYAVNQSRHCWCRSAITFTELIVCVKFGEQIFKQTQMLYVLYWLIFQVTSHSPPQCSPCFTRCYLCALYHVCEVQLSTSSPLWNCWLGDREGIWPVKILLQQSAKVLLWRSLGASLSRSNLQRKKLNPVFIQIVESVGIFLLHVVSRVCIIVLCQSDRIVESGDHLIWECGVPDSLLLDLPVFHSYIYIRQLGPYQTHVHVKLWK